MECNRRPCVDGPLNQKLGHLLHPFQEKLGKRPGRGFWKMECSNSASSSVVYQNIFPVVVHNIWYMIAIQYMEDQHLNSSKNPKPSTDSSATATQDTPKRRSSDWCAASNEAVSVFKSHHCAIQVAFAPSATPRDNKRPERQKRRKAGATGAKGFVKLQSISWPISRMWPAEVQKAIKEFLSCAPIDKGGSKTDLKYPEAQNLCLLTQRQIFRSKRRKLTDHLENKH